MPNSVLKIVESGPVVTLVAPTGGVIAGRTYAIGDIFCVAQETADAGEDFAALVPGVVGKFSGAEAGVSFATSNNGARVYRDAAAGKVGEFTRTNTDLQAGYALIPAAVADGGTFEVLLTGSN